MSRRNLLKIPLPNDVVVLQESILQMDKLLRSAYAETIIPDCYLSKIPARLLQFLLAANEAVSKSRLTTHIYPDKNGDNKKARAIISSQLRILQRCLDKSPYAVTIRRDGHYSLEGMD